MRANRVSERPQTRVWAACASARRGNRPTDGHGVCETGWINARHPATSRMRKTSSPARVIFAEPGLAGGECLSGQPERQAAKCLPEGNAARIGGLNHQRRGADRSYHGIAPASAEGVDGARHQLTSIAQFTQLGSPGPGPTNSSRPVPARSASCAIRANKPARSVQPWPLFRRTPPA